VSQFDLNGNFLQAFGHDVIPGGGTGFEVCTTATGCKAGTAGNAAGQFNTPFSIDSTPSGDQLVVAAPPSHRLSEFTGEPAFLRGVGYNVIPGGGMGYEICTTATGCQTGISGVGLGQFSSPLAAAYRPSGELLGLSPTGQFQEFTSDRTPIRSFGFPGNGAGNLSSPYNVAIGPGNEIVVADTGNLRIAVFGPSGNFLRAFGWDVIPGAPSAYEVCTVNTGCGNGASNPGPGGFNTVIAVAIGPNGEVYASDATYNRVSQFTLDGQFVQAFGFDVIPGGGTGFEICTAATGCQVGTAGAGLGQLSQPWGVDVDCRGTIFVAETSGGHVTVFGEPNARKPPCPSNAFTLGQAKLNKKKGTATIPASVPGPGALTLAGKNLKPVDAAPSVAGDVTLKIKPKGKLKKKLKRKGKAKAKPEVTFTPVNGDPNTQGAKVALKRKLRK
jgi:hypothetical protein